MPFISSETSSSQRVLGLPIGLLDKGFHLLIFCTLLSSALRSAWPNQFSLCFLINPIIFCAFNALLIQLLHKYYSTITTTAAAATATATVSAATLMMMIVGTPNT